MKTRTIGTKTTNHTLRGFDGHAHSANELLSQSGYYQLGGNGRLY